MATVTTLVPAVVTGISEANGLNDAGAVVGQEDTQFPFVWQPTVPNGTTGSATRLPTLPTVGGPGTATAMAINNNGEIVGFSDGVDASGNPVTRAVLWSGGQIFDLGTLIPDPANPGFFLGNSRAVDINDAGNIVGKSDSPFGEAAFLFDRNLGVMLNLFSLLPSSIFPAVPDRSRATSINNNGDIVGVANMLDPSGNELDRAFLLPVGAALMIDLGTLQPDSANPGQFLGNSSAFGINNNGLVVGTSDAGTDENGNLLTGATQFFNGSSPIALLPMFSDAFDIGPNDDVVGSFDQPGKGYVIHPAIGMVDLTMLVATPGMAIDLATGVNASGQISALATVGGSSIAVLISP